MKREQVVAFWDRAARETRHVDVAGAGMLGPDNSLTARLRKSAEEEHFSQIAQLQPHMTVLEVGTGGGRWCFFLADKVAAVTGIDISPEMIKLANAEKERRRTANVTFEVGDVTTLQGEGQFDLIYFSGMLQYVDDDDLAAVVSSAARLLKPSGTIISRDTIQTEQKVKKTGHYPVIYRTAEEYIAAFQTSGFSCDYMAPAYPDLQFVGPVSYLYRPLHLPFSLVRAFLLLLNRLNALFGYPEILKSKARKRMEAAGNQQQHCFFRYSRE